MSLTLRTVLGFTEAVIDDGGLKHFYQIAGILSDDFKINFTSKEDDFDLISWNFSLGKYLFTLQYSIYTGIAIFPAKTTEAKKRENSVVVELANILKKRFTPALS
jgi:hypothetical protein